MIIKLRQRSNKIKTPNTVINDEWVLFDNAVEVRFSPRAQVTNLDGFKALRKGLNPNATAFFMLKDPSECDAAETYHYNVIQFRDRVSGMQQEIVFDTIAFLMNDQGDTLQKIEG